VREDCAILVSETETTGVKHRKRRRWLRAVIALVLFFACLVVWLNGPGLRLYGPRVAQRFLEKAGLEGEFTVEGNLAGGLSISGFSVRGDGVLEELTVDRITPHYSLRGLARGEVDGFTVEGVHAELRFAADEDDEDKPPLDLDALAAALRDARRQAIPLNLEVRDLTVNATRDGEPLVSLGSSNLSHRAGSNVFDVELGVLTDASGREWNAQSSSIAWDGERLSLDRLDVLPGIGVRDLTVDLPRGGDPSLAARLLVGDGVLDLASGPGLKTATLEMVSGVVDFAEVLQPFGMDSPVSGELTELAIDLEGLQPDIDQAMGSARMRFRELLYEDWAVPDLAVEARLGTSEGTFSLRSEALGSDLELDGKLGIVRSEDGIALANGSGEFQVGKFPAVAGDLIGRIDGFELAAPLPESSLAGSFNLTFAENQPTGGTAQARISPQNAEAVSAIALTANWTLDEPLVAELTMDGVTGSGRYDLDNTAYIGRVDFDNFNNTRIVPWLEAVGTDLPGTLNISGRWTGKGNVRLGAHSGDTELDEVRWERPQVKGIAGRGGLSYDWPGNITLRGFELRAGDQLITLDAAMAEGMLDISRFVWSEGETEIATGSGRVPVPEDFANWRETLATDERPVELSLETAELALEKLEPWVPAMERLDPAATGQLSANITGSFADPVVTASLDLRNLSAPENPELPAADLSLQLNAADGRILLNGTATAPDFAPATITATMPFRPAEWAADPDLILDEIVDARVDLPRLELSRFATLMPGVMTISGVLTGDIRVSGPLREPDIQGRLDLEGGSVAFADDEFPTIGGVGARLEATQEGLILSDLRATIAGGSISGGGSLTLDGMSPDEIDFRLVADHVPVLRNELVIIRASADLRVQGAIGAAAVSGTIGLVDSLFYRDIEILPIGAPIARPTAADLPKIDTPRDLTAWVPEALADWTLNVLLRTDDPFLIRGNLGTGRVDASIRVGGTLRIPEPDGTAVISNATASLPFSTLTVRSGTLRFTPANGFDPTLEIRANAEPRPYRVDIYVYGQLSDPQLILTSMPGLPENEIMTLLATGTTTEGLEDPQAAATRAIQLLLEELRRGRFRFGRQLRPLLRVLDRVEFTLAEQDPYDSDAYSTATISLSDRWFLSAGMGEGGDTRLMAIWRFSFR